VITPGEAPTLIQYSCERCKTSFVLPPSQHELGLLGKIRAGGMAVGRTLRHRESLRSTYDGARMQLLARLDDDAYQKFVRSFKFCHECRQFVCSSCWSNSRRTCLGCFAKAGGTTVKPRPPFEPAGPDIPRPLPVAEPRTRSRLHTDASLLVMGAAILLLAVELVYVLPGMSRGGTPEDQPTEAAVVSSPSDAPTGMPTIEQTATLTPSPSPTEVATPTATPTPTNPPTPAPRVTRRPTPRPTAAPPTSLTVVCTGEGDTAVCTWKNPYTPRKSITWTMDGGMGAPIRGGTTTQATWEHVSPPNTYQVTLTVQFNTVTRQETVPVTITGPTPTPAPTSAGTVTVPPTSSPTPTGTASASP
jgi:hypothetical protein